MPEPIHIDQHSQDIELSKRRERLDALMQAIAYEEQMREAPLPDENMSFLERLKFGVSSPKRFFGAQNPMPAINKLLKGVQIMDQTAAGLTMYLAEKAEQKVGKFPALPETDLPIIGVPRTPLLPEFEKAKAEDPQASFIKNIRVAWENVDAPWGRKGLQEAITSPLNFIPVAKAGKAVSKTAKAVRLLPKPLPSTLVPPTGFKLSDGTDVGDVLLEIHKPSKAAGVIQSSKALTKLMRGDTENPGIVRRRLIALTEMMPGGRSAIATPYGKNMIGYVVNQDLASSLPTHVIAKMSLKYNDVFKTAATADGRMRLVVERGQVKKVLPGIKERVEQASGAVYEDAIEAMQDFAVVFDEVGYRKAFSVLPEGVIEKVFLQFDITKIDEFYDLTKAQRDWIFDLHQYLGVAFDRASRAGVEWEAALGGLPMKAWFSRMKNWADHAQKVTPERLRRTIGAKYWWQNERVYHYAAEGLQAGKSLSDDPMAIFEAQLKTLGAAQADQQFLDYLKTLQINPDTFSKKYRNSVALLSTIVTRKLAGEVIDAEDWTAFEKLWPQQAADLAAGGNRALSAKKVMRGKLQEMRDYDDAVAKASLPIEGMTRLDDIKIDPKHAKGAEEIRNFLFPTETLFHQLAHSKLKDWSDALRFLGTGLDLGGLMIHGFPFTARQPRVWKEAMENMAASLFDPEFLKRYWAARPRAAAYVKLGLDLGRPEMTEIVGKGRVGTRVGSLLSAAPFRAADRSFNAILATLKYEMTDAFVPRLLKEKGEQAARDYIAVLNKATGSMNPALIGMTATQRNIMSLAMFFAPLYRMASFGLILDLTKGRVRAEEAAKTLTALGGAMGAWMAIGKWFTGNEEAFDLTSPKFGSLKMGNTFIGPGTAYRVLMRAGPQVRQQIARDGLDSLVDISFDNVLIRIPRSMSSPFVSRGLDVLDGRTFVGDPMRDTEGDWMPGNVGTTLARSILPFWLDGLMYSSSGASFNMAIPEFFGLRAFPARPLDKINELRDLYLNHDEEDELLNTWRASQKAKGKKIRWKEAPALVKQRIEEGHEEFKELQEALEKQTTYSGRAKQRDFLEYTKELQKNRDTVDTELSKLGNLLESRQLGGNKFREGLRAQGTVLRNLHQQTAQDPDFKEIVASLEHDTDAETLDKMLEMDKKFRFDVLFDWYMNNVVLADDYDEDEDGRFDYKTYKARDMLFRERWGQEAYEYMQKRRVAHRNLHPAVVEYKEAVKLLEPYWEVHYTLFGLSSEAARLYDDYLSRPRDMRATFRQQHRSLYGIENRVKVAREKMRRSNSDIDWALVKFYETTPMTKAAKTKKTEWDKRGG